MGRKLIGYLIDSPLTYVPFRNIPVTAGKKDWCVLGVDFCFSESGVYGCIFSVYYFLVLKCQDVRIGVRIMILILGQPLV